MSETRSDDFCALTLDPNTGHRSLILSEKNRVVTRNEKFQRTSNHPERFDSYAQDWRHWGPTLEPSPRLGHAGERLVAESLPAGLGRAQPRGKM
ncbi:hypothetical protein QTP70_003349 [Hemibagrus guttatus]|uniref:SPRY-associated domain-containing protein n=1 Tax=Hemibagrus guttatus TaxID=175788 RepID=A0AAE0UH61_9TELE|nr:hypothetical protein QTP70_003349 [Hemibagrus guttatus]